MWELCSGCLMQQGSDEIHVAMREKIARVMGANFTRGAVECSTMVPVQMSQTL